MICMKCGKEVEDSGVFCKSCREVMAKYPVEPGTVVTFPRKSRPMVRKPLPKKEPAPEEQLRRLSIITKRLAISLVCVSMALILSLATIFQIVWKNAHQEDDTGKNYSTISPDDDT